MLSLGIYPWAARSNLPVASGWPDSSLLGLGWTEILLLHRCSSSSHTAGAAGWRTCLAHCRHSGRRDDTADSHLLFSEPHDPGATGLVVGQCSLHSPVRPASPCSRQLEGSAGENTISIIGTVQLYQPSWQRGNIFCLNPHRGQIVSSCSSFSRILWKQVKGHILQSSLAGTLWWGTLWTGQQQSQIQAVRVSVTFIHPYHQTHCVCTDDLGKFSC